MADSWYERLSMLDSSFLVFEGPQTYMHIAATTIFETGPLTTAEGGVEIGRIRQYVASRLPLIPRYRQRLAYTPVEGHPVWVDDHRFDLTYHVRHTSLPRPGTEAQLRELCARLLERPLNRAKPLWEAWVIEGLAGGRFALLLKVHHCMVDGLAGAELLAALLSPVAETEWDEAAEWKPRPAPSRFELLRDEVGRRAKMPLDLLRGLTDAARDSGEMSSNLTRRFTAAWKLVRVCALPHHEHARARLPAQPRTQRGPQGGIGQRLIGWSGDDPHQVATGRRVARRHSRLIVFKTHPALLDHEAAWLASQDRHDHVTVGRRAAAS